MRMERREPTETASALGQLREQEESKALAKPFGLSKWEVMSAYKSVRANAGSAGIDEVSLRAFGQDLKGNLYKLWNRLSSGSYFPPPVLRVEIPKAGGGVRPLGIPTVADRIAQTVLKQRAEPILEAIFDDDSYGYRPGRSAHDALAKTRERCWRRPWVVELDIKGFFDAIPHALLLKAVDKHLSCGMSRLYIRRWLQAGVLHRDGRVELQTSGTPQGGVISPVLANLFLHYAFDHWVRTQVKDVEFERYADDIVCHCFTRGQAEQFLARLRERMHACGLTLHPEKTRLVFCGQSKRHADVARNFDFLGYRFRLRTVKKADGHIGTSFTAAMSPKAMRRIRGELRDWRYQRWLPCSLAELADRWNPSWRGWLHYYGRFGASALHALKWHFDLVLARWWSLKYAIGFRRAAARLGQIRRTNPHLFVHWCPSARSVSVRAV
jgi:group II intron reverse transcriptase/maturase